MNNVRRCMHDGCDKTSNLVEAIYPDGEVDGLYCSEHMPDGFCWSCGNFCAGLEDFDFALERGGIKGCCWECIVQIRAECGEDEQGNFIEYDEDEEDWGP